MKLSEHIRHHKNQIKIDMIEEEITKAMDKALKYAPGEDVKMYSCPPEWVLLEDILDIIRWK